VSTGLVSLVLQARHRAIFSSYSRLLPRFQEASILILVDLFPRSDIEGFHVSASPGLPRVSSLPAVPSLGVGPIT
jgi:hypothetical protein